MKDISKGGAFLLLVAIFFASCGTEVKQRGLKGNKGTEEDDSRSRNCGNPKGSSFHEITVSVSATLPAKIAIDIDGERKVDECSAIRDEPPFVRLKKEGSEVQFLVEHGDFYETLPRDTAFTIFDLNACQGPEQKIVEVKALPLKFRMEYPNGPSCAGINVARARMIKQ